MQRQENDPNKKRELVFEENFKENYNVKKLRKCISALNKLYKSTVVIVYEVIATDSLQYDHETGVIEGFATQDIRICYYLLGREQIRGAEYKEHLWAPHQKNQKGKPFNADMAAELTKNMPAILLAQKLIQNHTYSEKATEKDQN